MRKPVSPQQRRAMFALFREAGMDDEMRREFCARTCGKSSLREMGAADARLVIQELKRRLGQNKKTVDSIQHTADREKTETRNTRPPAAKIIRDPNDMVSEEQAELIGTLYDSMDADSAARVSFNKRIVKNAWPQTVREAQVIIEALKKMSARGFRFGKTRA